MQDKMKSLVMTLLSIISSFATIAQKGDSVGFIDYMQGGGLSSRPQVVTGNNIDTSYTTEIVEYNKFVFEHRKKVYRWQLLSSKIIFLIVMLIVVVGLYLSYLQFKLSASLLTKKPTQIADNAEQILQPQDALDRATLQFNKGGLKIESAVIGLIILVISVAFFFLYLQFIFHIRE
jgi:hypothetical protein